MGIFDLIGWCIFGLIIGAIARFIMPGVQAMGWGMTLILGVVGSFVGGALSSLISSGGSAGLVNPAGWIMSLIGALIVLFVAGKMKKS
ncbi:GlsB/YeaQ/YmgE family stress response membrane protein [Rubinisphaera sp.]|uniref:GlsB/YeaQ/YmgE family stress response membrane protein n=1 Tax=Rubinisphaera sp. TaxID=2024857 RepID=UPI000C0DBF89|nr:GlsB/YeaQ/YmgE family stress response membrane protein [Rubinisphaera sp.]MBV09204.1 GlsB/YeaQ/YmgE family stress response membrane protein [Rubinisphaera sp.]|tara:strand:+ start:416 stop:679 length:264 start_codon:yes stop_codon:yes gene_type:complete